MSGTKDRGTFIQCQQCGHIYHIKENVPVDKLYVACICPKCDEYGQGLNCGSDESDIYLYMNENVDPRFYRY